MLYARHWTRLREFPRVGKTDLCYLVILHPGEKERELDRVCPVDTSLYREGVFH